MKKTIFLSLASLISFNVHGIGLYLNAGTDLANKCNKVFFECKRAESLAGFNGAKDALIYLLQDAKVFDQVPETQYENYFGTFRPLTCLRAVFGDEFEKDKAQACIAHDNLDEFHDSFKDMDYYSEGRDAIDKALPNPDDVTKFYQTFRYQDLVRKHEYPEQQNSANQRVKKFLRLA